ncbi:MAG: hypothetical protein MMC33_002469 [Icmadophila ericetorum]|nr:hypothetical protein [Icmadophila ericetorum]
MSSFLSSEAERALMGEEDEARRLFNQQGGGATTSAAALVDPQWALAHTSAQGQAYYHPDASQAVFSPYDAGEGEAGAARTQAATPKQYLHALVTFANTSIDTAKTSSAVTTDALRALKEASVATKIELDTKRNTIQEYHANGLDVKESSAGWTT